MNQDYHSNSGAGWTGGMNRQNPESSPFYAIERQIGKPVEVINFCLKNGDECAFPVVAIDEIRYHPGKGITLFGRVFSIHINGRNLQALHRHLAARKVKQIQEFCDDEVSEKELYVEGVRIRSDYDGG